MRSNKIFSKSASILFDTLRECDACVSSLEIADNKLDDECMRSLGEYLQDNVHLFRLNIGVNNITDKGVKILSQYLFGNTTLRKLDLSWSHNITEGSASCLKEIVMKTCINSVNLECTHIQIRSQKEILKIASSSAEERDVPIKSNAKSAAKITSQRN